MPKNHKPRRSFNQQTNGRINGSAGLSGVSDVTRRKMVALMPSEKYRDEEGGSPAKRARIGEDPVSVHIDQLGWLQVFFFLRLNKDF